MNQPLLPKPVVDALADISDEITWDNWQNEDDTFWKVCQVLYCRVDWLTEQIRGGNIDMDEALDTLEYVHRILTVMSPLEEAS